MAFTASPIIDIVWNESSGNPTTLCIPTQKTKAVLRGLIHCSDDLKQTGIKWFLSCNHYSQPQQSTWIQHRGTNEHLKHKWVSEPLSWHSYIGTNKLVNCYRIRKPERKTSLANKPLLASLEEIRDCDPASSYPGESWLHLSWYGQQELPDVSSHGRHYSIKEKRRMEKALSLINLVLCHCKEHLRMWLTSAFLFVLLS